MSRGSVAARLKLVSAVRSPTLLTRFVWQVKQRLRQLARLRVNLRQHSAPPLKRRKSVRRLRE